MWPKALLEAFWDLVNCRNRPAELKQLINSPPLLNADPLTLSGERWKNLPPGEKGRSYEDYANTALRNEQRPVNFIDDAGYIPALQDARAPLLTMQFRRGSNQIVLTDKRLGTLHISEANYKLELVRCYVDKISVISGAGLNLKLRNCWIKSFDMAPASLRHLEIDGGGILALHCPSADGENPFTGPVTIKNLYLPRSPGTDMNPQRLRDIRGHLISLHNTLAAGAFHGAELALDRPNESWSNRRFNWLYEVMADYGNSTTRPIISFFILLAIMTVTTAVLDDPVIADNNEAKGWKTALQSSTLLGQIGRSLMYAFSAIFNPLGVLNTKPLLLLTNPVAVVLVAIIGLFATLSLAFLVIGIRRRFKLE